MRWSSKPREPAEETKNFYWRNHGMVALSIDDPRMSWDLREMLRGFMTRQYGERHNQKESA